jgi:hypothetical protein
MSTIPGVSYRLADQISFDVLPFEKAVVSEPVEDMVPLQSENVKIFTPPSRQGSDIGVPKGRVLRRFRGFLVEERGEEARVILEDKGKRIDYYLPTRFLHSAGITEENQPFEMDEYEAKAEDDSFFTGYIFRTLAKTSDAFTDTFDLDDERKRKRSLIFEKFKDAAH